MRKESKKVVVSIELEEVVSLAEKLELLTENWAALLAEKMYGHDDNYTLEKGRQKVYNIKNGSTISPDSRALFVSKGLILYKELTNRVTSLKEQLSKIAS